MPYQSHSKSHRGRRVPLTREEELKLIRIEWKRIQELKEKHERHKQRRIEKFELERARKLALQKSRRSRSHSSDSSPSKSRDKRKNDRSKSPSSSRSKSMDNKTLNMSEKYSSGSSSSKLFKGPEGTKISTDELKKIKVEVGKQKKIGSTSKIDDIERDIVDPEGVIVIRRDGEGANPIFAREEFNPRDERRVIVETNGRNENRRRRSVSMSPSRRSRSPSRRTSRYDSSSNYYSETNNRHRSHSRERHDRHRDYRTSRRSSPERSHRHESHRSSSRERNNYYRNDSRSQDTHHIHRDARDYARDDLRERRLFPPYYNVEPMPVSFYYPNFARPIMINPMMPMRGPLPMGRGRMPPLMAPVRPPFMPRGFIPPEIFRQNIPPTQRYGRTF